MTPGPVATAPDVQHLAGAPRHRRPERGRGTRRSYSTPVFRLRRRGTPAGPADCG